MNPTRRQALAIIPLSALPLSSLFLTGCSQSSTDTFINITSQIVAGVQAALPIIALFVPPPYNLLEPEVATFLNLANSAAINIAQAAATNGTALNLAQVIFSNLGSVALNPTVLAQLPQSVQGAAGPVNTQALIQSLVTVVNNLLKTAADQFGGTVAPSATNVISTYVPPPAPSAAAHVQSSLARTQVKMTDKQREKVNEMLLKAGNSQKVLMAAPISRTITTPVYVPSQAH